MNIQTREFIIKKISHVTDSVVKNFLDEHVYFRSVEYMIILINKWVTYAKPSVLFCDIPNCDSMWLHCQRASTGLNSKNWNTCYICGNFCSNHNNCKHTYLERLPNHKDNYPKNNQRFLIKPCEPNVATIDNSINILTKDILSIILKQLIILESEDFERHTVEQLLLFRSTRQAIFAFNISWEEGDIKVSLCDKCEAFKFLVSKNALTITHHCESISWFRNNNVEDENDENSYYSLCNNCSSKNY